MYEITLFCCLFQVSSFNRRSRAVGALHDAGNKLRHVERRTARGLVGDKLANGVDGALGELVLRVLESMTAGTWPRLKVCARDACRWAFYDTSRGGTGKWCAMSLCGNRAKQEAWRARTRG